MEDRNPHALKSGDRVKVVGVGHRDYGKRGVIVKLEGVADADHGKARAVIAVDLRVYFCFVAEFKKVLRLTAKGERRNHEPTF